MSLPVIILFILILLLRKRISIHAPGSEWFQRFTTALYVVGGLAVLESVLDLEHYTRWVWYAALFSLLWMLYKNPFFSFARMALLAVAPVVVLQAVKDLLAVLTPDFYDRIDAYLGTGVTVAFTWMIAVVIFSNRQQKAALKEAERRRLEEERNQVIAARKDELEVLVSERTAALQQQKEELEHALLELQATQTQLVHREKMASLGELTAGVAHEIQNPLNFINNFSELNAELVSELRTEAATLPDEMEAKENLIGLLEDLQQNEQKILTHGKRADVIVKGMLQHARKSTGHKEATDIKALAEEYLQLAYHTFRANDKLFNVTLNTHYDPRQPAVQVVPQEIGRVLLNLFNNAFYSVRKKKQQLGDGFQPLLELRTTKLPHCLQVHVQDNGTGIAPETQSKIFQPFFTTKPTGEGTGLGLSLSYDIVKAHGGELKVSSQQNEGATFIMELPA